MRVVLLGLEPRSSTILIPLLVNQTSQRSTVSTMLYVCHVHLSTEVLIFYIPTLECCKKGEFTGDTNLNLKCSIELYVGLEFLITAASIISDFYRQGQVMPYSRNLVEMSYSHVCSVSTNFDIGDIASDTNSEGRVY